MFEQELADKFKAIFALPKVTYDAPSESREQDVLFIQVENSLNSITDGKAVATVKGKCILIQKNESVKFGFFSKAIARAPKELTKDLFFEDIEANTQRYRDLIQRGFSFTYFFRSQYDPVTGTITSVTTTVEETN